MKTLGIVLVVVGLLITVYTGVTFFTNEKVVDLGEVEISKNEKHHFDWSPVVGVVVMITGGAILLFDKKS